MRIIAWIVALGCCIAAGAQEKRGETLSSRQIVEYLASDSLAGRAPGSRGDSLARTFIAARMEALGLQPAFRTAAGERTWFQPFEIILSRRVEDSGLTVAGAGAETSLGPGSGCFPAPFSGSGGYEGPAVDAGYGLQIAGGPARRDDWADADVKGKCVILLAGLPPQLEEMAGGSSTLGNARNKALAAQDRGAAAVLLIEAPADSLRTEEESLMWTSTREFPLNIPVVRLSRETARQLFPEGASGMRVRLGVTMGQETVTAYNVAGILPGRTDEYIVAGAHYDHLGYGGSGSGSRRPDIVAVHNGADDNASGVAGVLHLAGRFASGSLPGKGLIFAAFGAEEKGLAGSGYFAERLPVERARIAAMFNFDMIGSLRGSALSLGGTGTALETDSLIERAVRRMPGLKIKRSPEGHGPSDHASFYAKKIPVFYFTTGGTPDYHTPGDDAWKLNYAGLDSVAAFAGVLLEEVMGVPQGLSFRESGTPEASPMRGGFKVTLGLMPDVTGAGNDGLRAEVVIKGKAADRAGMKSGDVIVEINGLSVSNIEDYMARLGTLRAGETAVVKVRRGDGYLTLEIPL